MERDRDQGQAGYGGPDRAIDVADVQELEGGKRVRFDLVVTRRGRDVRFTVETDVVRRSRVRSSVGTIHERLVVRTPMRLGPVERPIELGLVCRKRMLCRMLLGRTALDGRFLVDPGHRYLLGRRPRRPGGEGASR